ncbi:MAG: 1,4-alpha-glucan branching protein GlgB [Chlamydiales bacterium]|nr:1,4-alpha-glucan branching protein GlgB [Chlamydiales bacterium]
MKNLLKGKCYNPHAVLGIHSAENGVSKVIRVWRPEAPYIFIELFGKMEEMQRVHASGMFEKIVPMNTTLYDYKVYHTNGLLTHDPYAFLPTFGQMDEYLFSKGVHYKLYDVMGAHITEHQGCLGVKFAVWAPTALQVSVIGDFNYWNGLVNPMRMMGASGVWEIFIPGLLEQEKYKFEIKTKSSDIRIKSDPFAQFSEVRPLTASIVASVDQFKWSDSAWMQKRGELKALSSPMLTYEVHLGSWKKKNGHFLNYREIARELVSYCKAMGFTHVELMPIAEHPLDESWGYQVTGFYAVTSRYGTPFDFQYFVNLLHENEIGVILDWVPGHFPTDDFSLANFDGTRLYEHIDERQGFHPHWQTCIFNYGRSEVSNFLIANALFWMDKMHIDGLRVDAVASMLYLDYGRKEGEWIPNRYGGRENLEAIEFLKHLNSVVHEKFPGVLMIAEESTSFTGVTHPLKNNGLGFDLKWNMGWMNDTLTYFHTDSFFRRYHHNLLTFGLIYAFSEHFSLVLSHDEVVHGKGSLISKMPGDYWQKFANTRLLYSYMLCQPGKKLLFMGGEIGQWNEWNCKAEVEWQILQYPIHNGLKSMIAELNHFYLKHLALWQQDHDYNGFEWVDFFDYHNSVISYKRKAKGQTLLCVHNFTPTFHSEYIIRISSFSHIEEVFNTDEERYGGSGKVHGRLEIIRENNKDISGIKIMLAPLATQIYIIT